VNSPPWLCTSALVVRPDNDTVHDTGLGDDVSDHAGCMPRACG
jgi:hypothetical protein